MHVLFQANVKTTHFLEIIRFIFEEVDMPKNCPFGGTFVLVMGVAKMDHCSCANVLERHGASVQSFRLLNTNVRDVVVPRKHFFPTLENGTRVKSERIALWVVRLLGSTRAKFPTKMPTRFFGLGLGLGLGFLTSRRISIVLGTISKLSDQA